jgi:hypothetical protein
MFIIFIITFRNVVFLLIIGLQQNISGFWRIFSTFAELNILSLMLVCLILNDDLIMLIINVNWMALIYRTC